MFPALDPGLVQAICAEAPSEIEAINTLLALSRDIAEPMPPRPPLPPREVGVGDVALFPSLVDADGWEVFPAAMMKDENEDLGNAWCDRAKAAAVVPAPQRERAR